MEHSEGPASEGRGSPTPEGVEAREKLEAAYAERGEELIAWAARRTGSREDAEDLLHDAFAAALSGMGRVERIADPLGWLFASLRNKVIDLWRKRSRRGEFAGNRVALEAIGEIVAETSLGPEENFERDEFSAALNDAIAALPVEQRAVIEAQVFRGLSFREIADSTGISIDTLTARKRYAVRKIARALRSWLAD